MSNYYHHEAHMCVSQFKYFFILFLYWVFFIYMLIVQYNYENWGWLGLKLAAICSFSKIICFVSKSFFSYFLELEFPQFTK